MLTIRNRITCLMIQIQCEYNDKTRDTERHSILT